jgi:hypothetical protein
MSFSKLKASLRKTAERTILACAEESAGSRAPEARNYFRHAGYE